jgi:hypothetical protein
MALGPETWEAGPKESLRFPEPYAAFTNPILASFAQVTTVTTGRTWLRQFTVLRMIRQGSSDFQLVGCGGIGAVDDEPATGDRRLNRSEERHGSIKTLT